MNNGNTLLFSPCHNFVSKFLTVLQIASFPVRLDFFFYGSSEKCSIYLLQKLTGGTAECRNMIVPNQVVTNILKFVCLCAIFGLIAIILTQKSYITNLNLNCFNLLIFFTLFHYILNFGPL